MPQRPSFQEQSRGDAALQAQGLAGIPTTSGSWDNSSRTRARFSRRIGSPEAETGGSGRADRSVRAAGRRRPLLAGWRELGISAGSAPGTGGEEVD